MQSATVVMMTTTVMARIAVVTAAMVVMIIARFGIAETGVIRVRDDAPSADQNQTSQQENAENLLFHTHYF
jgi:hypothetical protein